MIYPPDVLDVLQAAVVTAWQGAVYRHMFGTIHPNAGTQPEHAGTALRQKRSTPAPNAKPL